MYSVTNKSETTEPKRCNTTSRSDPNKRLRRISRKMELRIRVKVASHEIAKIYFFQVGRAQTPPETAVLSTITNQARVHVNFSWNNGGRRRNAVETRL